MVEQVRVNPTEVRGYGNICEGHTLEDFIVSNSGLAKKKENVHGALTDVYKLVYSVYGLMFDFDRGNKQLYLQMGEADILSFGFDDDSKQLYLLDMARTGLSLGFDEDTNELYISDAPPIVHNYSLALDSESYTTSGSLSVSATLLDDGVPVSGATVSFTGGVSTVTATTNSSGVATATVNFTSSGTLTASYSNVSDTATVTVQPYLFYDACDSASGLSNYGSSVVVRGTNASASISYNSSENAYEISGTGNYFAGIPITPLKDLDNFKVTAEMKCGTNSGDCQIGFYTRDYTDTTKQAYSTHLLGDKRYRWFYVTPSANGSFQAINTSSAHYTSYTKMEWIVEGTSIKMNIYDSNDDVAYTITKDTVTYAKREFGFWINTERGTSYACYVKNIKAESL